MPSFRCGILTICVPVAEPGGYLQWDEGNPDTSAARSPRPEVSDKACAELLGLLSRFGKMFKMHTEWVTSYSTSSEMFLLMRKTW